MLGKSIFTLVLVLVALTSAVKEDRSKRQNPSFQIIQVPDDQDVLSKSWLDSFLNSIGFGSQPSKTTSTTTTTTRASTRVTTAASSSEDGVTYTPTPVESGEESSTTVVAAAGTTATTVSEDESTTSLTTLQKAHWCKLQNGTFLPLNYKFTSSNCAVGMCMMNKLVRYMPFQCMVTYCLDGSKPIRYAGQCCGQCASELPGKSCLYQGITYPHGTVMRSEKNKLQCWCQQGQVECRDYLGSVFDGMDLMGDGTAIYIIISVIVIVISLGLLLCCGCTIFFYYYYKRNQATFQQAYDQYYNGDAAGWQAMNGGEEGQDLDGAAAQQKLTELEQGQMESERYLAEQEAMGQETQPEAARPAVFMPPPYALYNGAYVSEDQHINRKDQL